MRPIVYTSIYGDYDNLKDQPDIGADYICFTDNPDLKSDCWEIRYDPIYQHLHPHRNFGRSFRVPHSREQHGRAEPFSAHHIDVLGDSAAVACPAKLAQTSF